MPARTPVALEQHMRTEERKVLGAVAMVGPRFALRRSSAVAAASSPRGSPSPLRLAHAANHWQREAHRARVRSRTHNLPRARRGRASNSPSDPAKGSATPLARPPRSPRRAARGERVDPREEAV